MTTPTGITVTLTIRFNNAVPTYTGKVQKTAEYLHDQVVPKLKQGFLRFTDDETAWDFNISCPEEETSQDLTPPTVKKRVDTTPDEYKGRSPMGF